MESVTFHNEGDDDDLVLTEFMSGGLIEEMAEAARKHQVMVSVTVSPLEYDE